jgi:rhamnose transport system substrate-binding protein
MKIRSPLNPMLTMLALVALGLSPAFAETKNDSFELAMVIKETTNPYYNATLAGARIAAGEIGGTANNYGPTQASGQAQVDLINNLADRHVPVESTRSRH